ncbi:MAG: hypothetical protein JWL77_2457 [Chthonomonadaceae bacterium]|nr:hypothetical protein [Chthonomonadaceae bacterium]
MNSKTRIGMVIAGITAVVTMGIGAPAFAGQTDHNSDYARQHRNDSQAIRRQKQRKWQMAHNHSGHWSDWNSNSNRQNGNSHGTTYGTYGSSHGSSNHNWSGSHSGRNGSGAGSGYSHSGQSNQNLGQSGHNRGQNSTNNQNPGQSGHNRGQNGTNTQNGGNRGQQTQGGQRTHSHDTSGNGG